MPSGSTAAQKPYIHGIGQSKRNVTIDGALQRNNVWHDDGNLALRFCGRVVVPDKGRHVSTGTPDETLDSGPLRCASSGVKAVVDDHLTRFAWRESLTVTWGPAA